MKTGDNEEAGPTRVPDRSGTPKFSPKAFRAWPPFRCWSHHIAPYSVDRPGTGPKLPGPSARAIRTVRVRPGVQAGRRYLRGDMFGNGIIWKSNRPNWPNRAALVAAMCL